MSKWLTKGARRWRTTLLVVLYGICVLAPTAALAFGDAAKAAHCLTDVGNGLAHVHDKGLADDNLHAHDGASAPNHSDDGEKQQSKSDRCCGLFCLSALAPSTDLLVTGPETPSLVPVLNVDGILAHGPDRLYRPPDSLLSL